MRKKRFYDQRREYNKLLIQESRWNHIYEMLEKKADEINRSAPSFYTSAFLNAGSRIHEKEGVLFISDWHYGLTTNNAWDTFNKEVADERIERLLEEVLIKLRESAIGTLHVAILGDMIAGAIHTTLRIESCENVVDQIMDVSERIAQFIANIAATGCQVNVYSTYGNHGRVVQKFSESIHSDNFERLIPFWLRQRLRDNPNIDFVGSDAHEMLRVCVMGHELCAVHGDLDCGKSDASLKAAMLFRKNYGADMRYFVTAHWHKPFTDGEMGVKHIGVGALCGADEYAKNKRLFSEPCQTMLIFDEDGLDAVHDIILR